MYISDFDTWFGVKKVLTGKGEELEQYRSLFEDCWENAQGPIDELKKINRDLSEQVEDQFDDFYTEDDVDSIKEDLKDSIKDDLKDEIDSLRDRLLRLVDNA